MDLLLVTYLEKYLDYQVYIRSRCKGNCNTHIYQFNSRSKSENSVRSYCKNASNDEKPHNCGSIQRVGKRLLHGTYRWRNPWFFLGNHFAWFSSTNTKNSAISKKKEKRSNLEVNIPDIREMFCRQAENGQRNERKDNNKVIVID